MLITFALKASAQPIDLQLPAPAHGAAAISALGAHLPQVAKEHGIDPQALITLFRTQPSLGVGRDGGLLYACKGLELSAEELAALADSTTSSISEVTTDTGATDVFKLHSLPGTPRVIYLDFDGHVTASVYWNTSYTNGQPIVSQPFSLDADSTTFSTAERDFIRKVWQRVAEDFAPFKVDVTTEDPGLDGLRRLDASDAAYGIRVVVSPTNWYGSGGGIANVGSFTRNTDTPCYVFTANLGNSEKPVGECCSHEAGHTVGLMHDGLGGSTPTEYYRGQGTWAPIMGNSYSRAVSQWSRGEYANSNNSQDDVAVIATYVPLTSDDHGSTLATASTLAGPTVSDGGTIETRNDVDWFRLDSSTGTISLNIGGHTAQPNVDIKAELLNSAGEVLQTNDSSTALSATINATVPAGTYYLRIDGVGSGDPVTTGYSDYASIGNYIITGSFPTSGTKQAPIAIATVTTTSGTAPLTVSFSGQDSTDADGTITIYHWAFGTGDRADGMNANYTYTVPGTYSAALTVLDSDGLSGTATIIITVSNPTNLPPIAQASASVLTGTAPVPVVFSADGSKDLDGAITSYKWDFGDGTSSTTASAAKTYINPGKYTAKLTVTDDRGASSSSAVDVSVLSDPAKDADVYSFTLSSTKAKSGTTASAAITVLDRSSRPLPGATITVQWSGVASGSSTGKTDGAGRVTLTSPRTKKSGLETAAITTVTPPAGSTYTPIFGVKLSQSITLP